MPRGSAAVAKTTQTRKKVRIPSMTAPCAAPTPSPSAGMPSETGSVTAFGRSHEIASAATTAPASWAIQ